LQVNKKLLINLHPYYNMQLYIVLLKPYLKIQMEEIIIKEKKRSEVYTNLISN
jgi:hypothetical protein